MSVRSDTTYTFGCDVPGCVVTTRESTSSPGGSWLEVKTKLGFYRDEKTRHYCSDHRDGILIALGLKKSEEPKAASAEAVTSQEPAS